MKVTSFLHPSSWPQPTGAHQGLLPSPFRPPQPSSLGGGHRGQSTAPCHRSLPAPHLSPSPSQVHPLSSLTRKAVLVSHWSTCYQPVSSNLFNPLGQRELTKQHPAWNPWLPSVLRSEERLASPPGPRELSTHPASRYFPTTPLAPASDLQPARGSSTFWKAYLLFFPKGFTPGDPSSLHPSSSSGSEYISEPTLSTPLLALFPPMCPPCILLGRKKSATFRDCQRLQSLQDTEKALKFADHLRRRCVWGERKGEKFGWGGR